MEVVPTPAEVRDVDTPFGTVRVLRFGTAGGAPLVLLPGKTAPAAMWAPNLAALSARRTVYALDLLGEPGRSVQVVPIRSTADQVRWLRATLDALDTGPLHVIGTSIGGWLALTLAAQTPAGLASLSLLDPAHTLDRIPLGTVVRSIGAAPFAPAWLRKRFLNSVAGGTTVDHDDPVADLIDVAMREYSAALPPPTYPSPDTLRAVRVPVLAILGGRSTMLDAQRARRRAETFLSDVRAEVWPEASHALPGEQAEATNTRLLAFADRVDRMRAGVTG
ncbi:alpha/beta fold hydrolase [Saccharopolyspora sp. 5N708]|uniref:alpha/beta fold hydrolase n=1 Tax=Saccharopolyspora sp. 5N708 TaxID=3457424 RepID=UPI003FD3CCB8